jgi:hypothetical protein
MHTYILLMGIERADSTMHCHVWTTFLLKFYPFNFPVIAASIEKPQAISILFPW